MLTRSDEGGGRQHGRRQNGKNQHHRAGRDDRTLRRGSLAQGLGLMHHEKESAAAAGTPERGMPLWRIVRAAAAC